MVKHGWFLVAAALLCTPAAAAAREWSPLAWRAQFEVVSSSDLFPGYTDTRSDRGVHSELEVETSRRLSSTTKLGLTMAAGAIAFGHFEEARYGWLGAGATLRTGRTRFETSAELTPRRVKFPSVPEDASFKRVEWRAGARQALGERVDARIQGRWAHDDYVTIFDSRDAQTTTGIASVAWQPVPRFSFAGRLAVEDRHTQSPDHRYGEHEAAGRVAFDAQPWQGAVEVLSGVRRYREAPATDGNFGRRDQWQEVRLEASRRTAWPLAVTARVGFRDQTSSRLDRSYDVSTFSLGIEWWGGPK